MKSKKVFALVLVYKSPDRREAVVVDHSPIKIGSRMSTLTGNLGLYTIPAECPNCPGLWLLKTNVHVPEGRGTIRIDVLETERIIDPPEQLDTLKNRGTFSNER